MSSRAQDSVAAAQGPISWLTSPRAHGLSSCGTQALVAPSHVGSSQTRGPEPTFPALAGSSCCYHQEVPQHIFLKCWVPLCPPLFSALGGRSGEPEPYALSSQSYVGDDSGHYQKQEHSVTVMRAEEKDYKVGDGDLVSHGT